MSWMLGPCPELLVKKRFQYLGALFAFLVLPKSTVRLELIDLGGD
jgi:hypothetical protein